MISDEKGLARPVRILCAFLSTGTALALTPNMAISQSVDDSPAMEELDPLLRYGAAATGISADGTVVVGDGGDLADYQAFRWVEGEGLEILPSLFVEALTRATGVNADGSVVVGYSEDWWLVRSDADAHKPGFRFGPATTAFRWVEGEGMESLGALDEGLSSQASAVNADGSVVVGFSEIWGEEEDELNIEAFRWIEEDEGMESLGVLRDGDNSWATGVNADGTVVVGYSDNPFIISAPSSAPSFHDTGSGSGPASIAFRWVEGGEMQGLGALSEGASSWAAGVNADGTVVVGASEYRTEEDFFQVLAFRWIEGEGMKSLGARVEGGNSWATAVNADGAVVVGYSDDPGGTLAFRWVEGEGMESLGVLGDAEDSRAFGVSADGSVVVGESGGRAFIYRASMLDLLNTQSAIGQSAASQAGAITTRNAALSFALGRELRLRNGGSAPQEVVSSQGQPALRMPMAIRLDGAVVDSAATGQMQYAGVSGAFGLSDTLTLGGFVSTGSEATTETGFSMSGNQPALGIYLRSGDAGQTGLTWKVALGAMAGNADIARPATLANTEAGHGTASLDGRSASAEVGYGFNAGAAMLSPFVQIASATTTRGAYTEASDISFPVSYDAYSSAVTTFTLGLNGEVALGENTGLHFGIGIETDLARSTDSVSGTSAIPGMTAFSVSGPAVINPTRGYASFEVSHALGNGNRITLGAGIGQSAYSTDPTANVGIGYEVHF